MIPHPIGGPDQNRTHHKVLLELHRLGTNCYNASMFSVAHPRERFQALLLALALGNLLAVGFLPVSQELGGFIAKVFQLGPSPWYGALAFPALAAVFYFSLPRPPQESPKHRGPATSLALAVTIALISGIVAPRPSLFHYPYPRIDLAWTLLLAPWGEELLFRGWLSSLGYRLWRNKVATATNPLPLFVWVQAVAFSLWHWQNWGSGPVSSVLLQVAYTLPVGLWLGWVRWKSGGLTLPLICHCAINLAALLF